VGSRSYDINTNDNQSGGARNINALPLSDILAAQQNSGYLTQSLPNPFAGLVPQYPALNGATAQLQLLHRPYPLFQNVTMGQESVGRIWYDSLQVSVEKRYSKDLVLVAAYTRSKNLEAIAFLNDQDAKPVKNLTASDRPNRLVLSGVWELPFGTGKFIGRDVGRGWNMLIGGWEYNFIGTIQSGTPIDGLPANVNLIADPSVPNQSFSHWFNNCVLQTNGTSLIGSQPGQTCTNPAWQIRGPNQLLRTIPFRVGSLRIPWAKQWDMSFNKKVYFSERFNAQVRLEAFNVFNTPIRSGLGISPTSANFGIVPAGQAGFPRQVQLGFKFDF
jgi:hypothetical protein